jgi:hypothetical protein
VRERANEKISNKENKLCFTFDFVVFAVRGRKRDKEEEKRCKVFALCCWLFLRGCSLELKIIKYTLTLTRLVVARYGREKEGRE